MQTSSMLTRHGYRVVESATPEQTVTAAHNGAEAILLDTSLDGMNGWEILPMLRRLEPEAHTPIVLLSLDADRQQHDASTGLLANLQAVTKDSDKEDVQLRALTDVICGPGERARILIVEHDQELAGAIREAFSRENASVRMAHSLEDAVNSCFTFRPHLLILDLGMPNGDGFNVVDWLRQHESLARLPLAIYTGANILEADRNHLMLGPTHFLSRARVQPQQLEALVLTMLRNTSQMEEAAQRV
jgi:CheY-like chemotaxis protein